MSLTRYLCGLAASCLIVTTVHAIDLQEVQRRIAREPDYASQPKYCLVVFGPEATTRVWLVLDGDALYVDRNANGDLTDDGEPLTPDVEPGDKRAEYPFAEIRTFPRIDRIAAVGDREYTRFEVVHTTIKPEFTPRTRHHRELEARFQQDPTFTRAGVTVYLDDQVRVQAGSVWSERAETAPICHIDGPLTMAPLGLQELQRGADPPDVFFALGFRGLAADGPEDSFAIIDYEQVPEDLQPIAEFTFPHREPDQPPITVDVRLSRC